jgi:hypothetical protein
MRPLPSQRVPGQGPGRNHSTHPLQQSSSLARAGWRHLLPVPPVPDPQSFQGCVRFLGNPLQNAPEAHLLGDRAVSRLRNAICGWTKRRPTMVKAVSDAPARRLRPGGRHRHNRREVFMASLVHDYASVDAFDDATRRAATRDAYSPVMILLTIVSTLGVLYYGSFLLRPENRGDMLPWLLVIVSESILVFHGLASMWTILAGQRERRDWTYQSARAGLYDPNSPEVLANVDDPSQWPLWMDGRAVTVDVLITVYGEPLDVIRRTAEAALAIRGQHSTWILDDGRSDEVQTLAERARLSLCPPPEQQRRQGGQHQQRPSRSPRETTSSSSTPTSCRCRASSNRRCRSSRQQPSRSYRLLRRTATCTTSSRGAPATCSRCSTASCSLAGTLSTPPSASART